MKIKVPHNAQLIGEKPNYRIIYKKSAIYCTPKINGKNSH